MQWMRWKVQCDEKLGFGVNLGVGNVSRLKVGISEVMDSWGCHRKLLGGSSGTMEALIGQSWQRTGVTEAKTMGA